MTSTILDSTDTAFDNDVLHQSGVVLVDFWADWCGPCKTLSPILEKVAQAYVGKAQVVKVNADENAQTADRFGVRGLPTMLIFKNGEVVQRLVGVTTQTRISVLLDQHLGSSAEPQTRPNNDVRAVPAWFDYAVEVLSSLMPEDVVAEWRTRWQQTTLSVGGNVLAAAAAAAAASRLINTLLQDYRPALERLPSAAPLLAALTEVQRLHAQAAAGNPPSPEAWQGARAQAAKAAGAEDAEDVGHGPDVNEIAACVQAAAWDPAASPACVGEVLDTWMAWRDAAFDQAFGWRAEDNAEIQKLLTQMQADYIDNQLDAGQDVFKLLREHHPAVAARMAEYMRQQRQWQDASLKQAAQQLADVFVAR